MFALLNGSRQDENYGHEIDFQGNSDFIFYFSFIWLRWASLAPCGVFAPARRLSVPARRLSVMAYEAHFPTRDGALGLPAWSTGSEPLGPPGKSLILVSK